MSLATVSTGEVIRQQVTYKWYAYTDLLRSLVFLQVIAIILSAVGTGGMGTSDDMFSLEVTTYSTNLVFAFTVFWLLITPAMITSKSYLYEDFSFVTTRFITQLSNAILFTVIVFIATTFTVMSSYLIYLVMSLTRPAQYFPGLSTVGSPEELLIAGVGMFGYYLIAVAVGYLFGTLIKISKLFFVLIPVFLVVPELMDNYFLYEFLNMFYVQESSLSLFLLKAILTALASYSVAALILNRREVREV